MAVELEDPAMVLPERPAVGDGHERDAQALGVLVHDAFHVERHGARALVQDGEAWAVVEAAGHGNALLEPSGKHVAPLGLGVPALRVQGHEMFELQHAENGQQVVVRDAPCRHLPAGVGIDDLLAQGST